MTSLLIVFKRWYLFLVNRLSKVQFKIEINCSQYPIKDKVLLIQCGIAFFVVICLFCLHSVPYFENVSLGWASVLGVCLLLIISNNNDDFKACLLMVEWSSLLFFATLFVLMESLTKIGLIKFIGEQMSDLVKLVDDKYQLITAILLVLWVIVFLNSLCEFSQTKPNVLFVRCPH